MSEGKGLVAVLLDPTTVRACADAKLDLVDCIQDEFKAACKRALRPGPPTSGVMHWLRDHGKHGLGEYAGAAAWIEYVREHGWEAGE